jgi:YtkA-like
VGRTTITLKLADSSGNPVTKARVTLEGNMSHAGMVPVYAETTELQPGRYQANMELTMAGDWNITVHVNLSNGLGVERQFEIKGVSSP